MQNTALEYDMLKVLSRRKNPLSSTDRHLQVKSYADYEVVDWDGSKITKALTNECGITESEADEIQKSVYEELKQLGKKEVDIKTIKSFVNYHLVKRGHNGAMLSGQLSLGMSLYDLRNLITSKSTENSNISTNNPEAISQTISENTIKQFALKEVFSPEVSNAHLEGKIHLHDLGCITKAYCSSHSLRALAMHGLGKYFMADIKSSPAKHAMTLVGHLNTYLCSMAHYYAGALGVDFVNIYFAPYVEHMDREEMKQIAQYLIFSLSQSAFSRGGQVLFTDFNVHLTVPDWLKKVNAVGPGGEILDRTYADFEEVSQDFLEVMLEVWRTGDVNGMPFPFPKMDLHICSKDFEEKRAKELLEMASQIASENGSPYFIFDKDSTLLAACCRLRTRIDENLLSEPERIRFTGFQNVTVNLPQCAYRSEGDLEMLYSEIDKSLDLVVKAHMQKIDYIKTLGEGPGLPMYDLLGKEYFDGKPYIDLDAATYIVGIIGVNEAVSHMTGYDLHESQEAYDLGYEIICHMYAQIQELSEETGLHLSIEESPAESAARRLALVDIGKYSQATKVVNGNLLDRDVYYTNSVHYKPDADIDFITRLKGQSEFHNLIDSGAIVHMFCGEDLPPADGVFNIVKKTFDKTDCAQLTISPEFTSCRSCASRSYGLHDQCKRCGSGEVDHVSRIVGYYSKISNWNDSKKRELEDRQKGKYSA